MAAIPLASRRCFPTARPNIGVIYAYCAIYNPSSAKNSSASRSGNEPVMP
jgi:hypothetical protein